MKMDKVINETYLPKWKETPVPSNWPMKNGKTASGSSEVLEFKKAGDMDFAAWLKGVDSHPGCKTEVCSAFSKASARGLAKLGVYFANGGSFGDKSLISEGGIQACNSEPIL